MSNGLTMDENGDVGKYLFDVSVCPVTGIIGQCGDDPDQCVGHWLRPSTHVAQFVCLGGGLCATVPPELKGRTDEPR